MNHFINFHPQKGVSVDTFRSIDGYANFDVLGLLDDFIAGRPGNCPAEGSLAALEDGSILPEGMTGEIEDLHDQIRTAEDRRKLAEFAS